MRRREFGWYVMTLLAFAVSGYAAALILVPGLRNPLARGHIAEHPVAAMTHFIAGATALAVGALQLNAHLRARFVAIHRWLGRLYVVAILGGGLAGLALAPHSSGGAVSSVGFGLLAFVSLGTTGAAYYYVRQRDLSAHRDWMIRSYSLTFAAVTLRIYLPLAAGAGASLEWAYPAIAWLCWVPNLLIAEWFVRSSRSFAAVPAEALRSTATLRPT